MPRPRALLLAGAAALAAAAADRDWPQREGLQRVLEDVTKMEAKKYNCSISVALKSANGTLTAASGTVDFSTMRQASTGDQYPWGSVTKMLTAASIMKLVSTGAISLEDQIGPLVDPLLGTMQKNDPNQTFASVRELWGDDAAKTTVRELLSMKSGIPDFDTAKPNPKGVSEDPLRQKLYDTPKTSNSPTQLMSVPWVAHHFKPCQKQPSPVPLGAFCYSSTNFMLLGMVLAAKAGDSSWRGLNQSLFLPEHLRPEIRFANRANPRDWGLVHGYDRTSYNMPKGLKNDHDNWEVDGVLSGWTASNVLATPATVAELTWQIYGPPAGLAPKEFRDMMVPHGMQFYGLGTFNLTIFTGHFDEIGVAYGHLGATYGYQSVTAYFPELNLALSVATNIETDNQAQPADTVCNTYNAVAGLLLGRKFECSFASLSYYFSRCVCKGADDGKERLLMV